MWPEPRLARELRAYLDRQRGWVAETVSQLIAYPSISGKEQEITSFLEQLVGDMSGVLSKTAVPESLGADIDYSPALPDAQPYSARPNLINFRRGRGAGRSLIVCGHTDVVPADWAEAFTPRIEGDVIFGRGACDAKGPLAAGLLALRALDHLDIQLAGDLETHLVIEEEVGGNGALALLLEGRRADGVIVLEPSELAVHPAGRGALWFRIDIEGRSTHMAYIREGVNAAKEAIKVVQALERYEQRLIADSRGNPLFARYEQPVMVNIGMLNCGDWPASVPARATIEGGVGFLFNRSLEVVRREVTAAVLDGTGDWVRDHHRVSFERLHNEAYQLDADHPLPAALYAACGEAGITSEICGMVASCDARLYCHRGGMPAVVFGPGSARHAHGRHEQVKVSDILQAAEALVYLTRQWCGWV
jgi:acetylornithine deacetylase